MNKKILFYVVLLLNCLSTLTAKAPLFVSLGSHCEIAAYLRCLSLRKEAFPFDWLLTLNHQGFLTLLEDDCAELLNKKYLALYPRNGLVPSWKAINSYYGVEFLHDWATADLEGEYPGIQEKYQRRITRFKKLDQEIGKVYFFRSPFDYAIDPTFRATSNYRQITSQQAKEIKKVLDKKFSHLNFQLVIINYAEEGTPPIEKIDGVIEFKIRKTKKLEDYQNMFNILGLVRK